MGLACSRFALFGTSVTKFDGNRQESSTRSTMLRELFPAFAALSRASLSEAAECSLPRGTPALGAGNRCPGAILLLIARSNLHRWPSRRAWCKSESKVRLARFCLAERQVSPSARSIAPRSFPLVIPVPRGEPVDLLLLLHASSLTHSDTRAEFRAISVHPGLGPTDIYQQRQRESDRSLSAG